jgi:hypothetical protein
VGRPALLCLNWHNGGAAVVNGRAKDVTTWGAERVAGVRDKVSCPAADAPKVAGML